MPNLLGKRRNYFPDGVYTDNVYDNNGDGLVAVEGLTVDSVNVATGTISTLSTDVIQDAAGGGITVSDALDCAAGVLTNTIAAHTNDQLIMISSTTDSGIGYGAGATADRIMLNKDSNGAHQLAITDANGVICRVARSNGATTGVDSASDDMFIETVGGFIMNSDSNSNGIGGNNSYCLDVQYRGTSQFYVHPFPLAYLAGAASLPTNVAGRFLYYSGASPARWVFMDGTNAIPVAPDFLQVTNSKSAAPTATTSGARIWQSDGTTHTDGDVMVRHHDGSTTYDTCIAPVSPFAGSVWRSTTMAYNGTTPVTVVTSATLPVGKYAVTYSMTVNYPNTTLTVYVEDGAAATLDNSTRKVGPDGLLYLNLSHVFEATLASATTLSLKMVQSGADSGNAYTAATHGTCGMSILRVA
jgi:hypothetical protein